MAVTNSNSELSNRDHLLLGVVEGLVKLPSHHVDIAGEGLQVVQGLLGAKVSSAENVLDPARNQQFFKLCW